MSESGHVRKLRICEKIQCRCEKLAEKIRFRNDIFKDFLFVCNDLLMVLAAL